MQLKLNTFAQKDLKKINNNVKKDKSLEFEATTLSSSAIDSHSSLITLQSGGNE
jgi:hypothetical protein